MPLIVSSLPFRCFRICRPVDAPWKFAYFFHTVSERAASPIS